MSENWKKRYDEKLSQPALDKKPDEFDSFYQLSEVDHLNVDTDAAWKKILSKLSPTRKKNTSVSMWKVAASVILVLSAAVGVYFVGFNNTSPTYLTEQTTTNQRVITLPDGSRVTLARYSNIQYPSVNFITDRNVRFEGEAFFDVQKAKSPFSIYTKNARIKVLGTSFNLNTKDETTLFVQQGKVQLTTDKASQQVNQGEFVRSNKLGKIIFEAPDPNTLAWKTGEFDFSDTRVSEAFALLSKHYEVEFTANKAIQECRITVQFKKESLEDVVDILSTILNAKSKITEKKVSFRGKGCL